ncbi:alpha/beta fold hydrolase [Streptomyces sp. NPDC052052]|uniref:thioesterase II family protein n=1 Tax=Streptomyces sp. NPDC052052 TaxID=3154756 RepID=UPI003448854D
MPQSGAAAGAFSRWRAHLPQEMELAPVELPGRGTRAREPMPSRFDAVADALYEGLRPEFDLPYVLFGHSFGGMLAYEVARRVQRDGVRAPLAVFVSGTRAPHIPQRQFVADAEESVLLDWLSRSGGLPAELFQFPDFLQDILRVVRTDLRIAESYLVPEPVPLTVPLHGLAGADDVVTPPEAVPAWERCAAAGFTVTTVPGNHDFPQASAEATVAAVTSALAGVALTE